MKILALDPATHCGWALSNSASGTWDLSIRRDESAGMRLIRLQSKLNETAKDVDLVVFEAARNCAPKMQGALVVQAELQGIIKIWCETNGVNYRGYSPSELKKHATGKGNAGKAQMVAAAANKWPEKFNGASDDNEVDARWLLDLAEKELVKNA